MTRADSIDVAKRYDVYCAEPGIGIAIYRNVRFKALKRLLSTEKFDVSGGYYELEQADGTSVFVSRHGLMRFCEHGVRPKFDSGSAEKG